MIETYKAHIVEGYGAVVHIPLITENERLELKQGFKTVSRSPCEVRAELLIDDNVVAGSIPIVIDGPGEYVFRFERLRIPAQVYGIRYAFKNAQGHWQAAGFNSI